MTICLHMIYDRAEDIKEMQFSVVSKIFNLVATHTSYSHRNYIFVNCDFIFHHSCDNIPKVEFKFASNTSLTFYLCLIPFFLTVAFHSNVGASSLKEVQHVRLTCDLGIQVVVGDHSLGVPGL